MEDRNAEEGGGEEGEFERDVEHGAVETRVGRTGGKEKRGVAPAISG